LGELVFLFKLKTLKCIGFKRLRIPEEIIFPEGLILIFGRNESGKSTVMEAIHYGLYGLALRPNKRASNDDLINYGYPQAVIELVFSIDYNEYNVKRVLKRKGTNIHELVILRPDGKRERVTGARTVNNLILEELHGIDSEALLNSCLVEQKELGKLEASVRAKRIEAMASLLNIETFVEAQQDLKNSSRALENKNQETLRRLEKAEQAKTDFEKAEEKLENAQSRIEEILAETEKVAKKITELEQILEIIDRIKEINGVIDTKTVKVDGLKRELVRIEEILREAEEALDLVKQIENELPTARLRFEEAEVLNKALEKLQGLENKRENARGEEKRARERLVEVEKKVEEAKQASEQLGELSEKISEYKPATIAQNLLTQIEACSQNIRTARLELERLKKNASETKSKLEALKDAEIQIGKLEEQEKGLISTKGAASQKRIIGFIFALLGIISAIGISYSQYLLPLGGILILIGAVLIIRNSPSNYDPQLQELRIYRESLLGEKARITDYQQNLGEIRRLQEENEEKLTESETELESIIPELPSTPREYSEIIDRRSSNPS
jgi:exonuclease SbcC